MEAVPRLPMICADIKVSPSNTDFGHTLRKYIRDFYHEDAESYNKEIKELEALRQNAIKAPMDFTGCSILKRYYSQLHKLQSRFPMTDDGPACVPFMWTDIYSGVAYNITDIEYEEACILYNIGALHSKLGTMDSRCNAEGMKIACTHFQCAAWAFQHLRDTFPQPKGSDMSHDLLTFFINIMLAQAQECILEKSMLDSRKSSITAKIAAQVVDYYKCALGIMVSGSPSSDAGSILDIVGSKIYKGWKKFIEFKMCYYASISYLYMGNQAEEHEKWGERVAWFQLANDYLTEAFKVAKSLDRDDLNEPLSFTLDVIVGKLNSSKKENEFVYHDKVPALTSLPELKGASLVKGIPFSITDPDVSGPDIFARLVPMEAHETSSLYSEEKAKLLRSISSKIESKNEELIAYLSSLQLESGFSFEEEEKIPQELLEKCASMSVRPTAISDLQELMKELMSVSKDVDSALKSSFAFLMEEEQKELKHQEVFGKRSPSLLIMELKKECSKYDEAHRKAIESNNTLESVVNIHIANLSKLLLPLEELAEMLPSVNTVKTPENVKAMEDFNHLISKVDEMKSQRIYLEQQLRDALQKDDITTDLVTMKKKEDLQKVFDEEIKKHSEVTTYIEQNLSAQDNILFALTEANARYAETRKVISQIKKQRLEMVRALVDSYDAYDDVVSKIKKGLEFYQKLQTNVNRLLTRIRGVTKVQEEERAQIAEVRNGPRIAKNPPFPSEPHVPKLKDYLPYLSKDGSKGVISAMPPGSLDAYSSRLPSAHGAPEPIRQATLGGPAVDFNRKLKPNLGESTLPKDKFEAQSIGIRPTPVGSEQPSVSAVCATTIPNVNVGSFSYSTPQMLHPGASFPPVVPPVSNFQSGPLPGQYQSDSNYSFPSNYGKPLNSESTSNYSSGPSKIPNSTDYNYGGVTSNTAINSNMKMTHQMPPSIASVPQHCSSLSAVPSVPSQINRPFMSTNTPSVSSSNYASNGALQLTNNVSYATHYNPGSNGVLPNNYMAPYGSLQYSTGSSAYPNVASGIITSAASSLATPVMSSSGNIYSQSALPSNQAPIAQNQSILRTPVPSNLPVQPNQPTSQLPFYTSSGQTSQHIVTPEYNMRPQLTAPNGIPNANEPEKSVGRPFINTNSSGILISNVALKSSQALSDTASQMFAPSHIPFNPDNRFGVQQPYYSTTTQYTVMPPPMSYPSNVAPVPHSSGNIYTPNGSQATLPGAASNNVAPVPYSSSGNIYATNGSQAILPGAAPNNAIPCVSTAGSYGGVLSHSHIPNQCNYGTGNMLPPMNIGTKGSGEAPGQLNLTDPNTPVTISYTIPGQEANMIVAPRSELRTVQSNAIRDLITPPLETNPDKDHVKTTEPPLPPVLQPKVIDINEIKQLKEKEAPHLAKDPLDDPAVCSKFVSEVEKYEKFVDGLVRKSLNGTTPLDQKWKELIDAQDKESRKLSISVARCYPLKNRFPDVMPYDNNRVKLVSAKDDYINASYLKDICPGSPVFVITQAPLPATFNDFWLMVWEQQVETLVCLLSDSELKNHVYFPKERGQVISCGAYEISLHSYKEKNGFIERMVNITHTKNRTSRVVVHLQFTQWPASGTPNSPAILLQFIFDALSYHKQQRNLMRPVVVHCSSGIGRSGCFCLVTALVNEMNGGHGPRDVAQVAAMVSQQRKFLIQDKDQLKFCYDAVLYYAQDLLMKRGILTSKASFDDKLPGSGSTSSHVRHPSEDFILGGGLAKLQSGIEKLSVASDSKEQNGIEAPSDSSDPQVAENSDVPVTTPAKEDPKELDDSKKSPSEDKNQKDVTEPSIETSKDSATTEAKTIPSITSLLDPSNFTLDSTGSPGKRKITKENFANSKGSLSTSSSDSADPLSQLDPLWSLKKQ